jgi:hypothetical protein
LRVLLYYLLELELHEIFFSADIEHLDFKFVEPMLGLLKLNQRLIVSPRERSIFFSEQFGLHGEHIRLFIFKLHSDTLLSQHLFQPPILSFQFQIFLLEHIVFISVDNRRILDVHGLAGVLEGVETLFVVEFCGTDAGDHVGVGVTPEAVLEDAGEF